MTVYNLITLDNDHVLKVDGRSIVACNNLNGDLTSNHDLNSRKQFGLVYGTLEKGSEVTATEIVDGIESQLIADGVAVFGKILDISPYKEVNNYTNTIVSYPTIGKIVPVSANIATFEERTRPKKMKGSLLQRAASAIKDFKAYIKSEQASQS